MHNKLSIEAAEHLGRVDEHGTYSPDNSREHRTSSMGEAQGCEDLSRVDEHDAAGAAALQPLLVHLGSRSFEHCAAQTHAFHDKPPDVTSFRDDASLHCLLDAAELGRM